MNKQRYIAELAQLLSFMTSADRAETLRRYGDMFDAAGEAGAQALIKRIGSPTAAAVRLSRAYAPGHIVDEMLPDEMAAEAEAGAGEPQTETLHGTARFIAMPLDAGEEDGLPEPTVTVERAMPLWAGIPLFILAVVVIALPLAAVVIALLPVLAAPGAAVLVGAWVAFVGGLWCISYIADAVMLFGVAFIILAVGLFVLFAGLWLAVKLITLYCRALRGLKRLMLGRKVVRYA